MSLIEPTGRLARWACYLQFTFNIVHRKGINHANADALSRSVNTILIENESTDAELAKAILMKMQR
jgi:hypothetical protein